MIAGVICSSNKKTNIMEFLILNLCFVEKVSWKSLWFWLFRKVWCVLCHFLPTFYQHPAVSICFCSGLQCSHCLAAGYINQRETITCLQQKQKKNDFSRHQSFILPVGTCWKIYWTEPALNVEHFVIMSAADATLVFITTKLVLIHRWHLQNNSQGVCRCLALVHFWHCCVLSEHTVCFCWCVCCLPLITAAGSQTERGLRYYSHNTGTTCYQDRKATLPGITRLTANVWSGSAAQSKDWDPAQVWHCTFKMYADILNDFLNSLMVFFFCFPR